MKNTKMKIKFDAGCKKMMSVAKMGDFMLVAIFCNRSQLIINC